MFNALCTSEIYMQISLQVDFGVPFMWKRTIHHTVFYTHGVQIYNDSNQSLSLCILYSICTSSCMSKVLNTTTQIERQTCTAQKHTFVHDLMCIIFYLNSLCNRKNSLFLLYTQYCGFYPAVVYCVTSWYITWYMNVPSLPNCPRLLYQHSSNIANVTFPGYWYVTVGPYIWKILPSWTTPASQYKEWPN